MNKKAYTAGISHNNKRNKMITKETFKTSDGVVLHWDLAQQKGLTTDEIQAIMDCHIRRVVIFDAMRATNDKDELHDFADEIEELEFEMQAHWHFAQDKDYHMWWLRSPKCQCPQMDNRDPMYFGQQIIMSRCPVHGFRK